MSTQQHSDDGPKLAYEIAQLEARRTELSDALVDGTAAAVSDIRRALERLDARLAEKQEALAGATPTILPSVDTPWPEDAVRRNALVSLVVEAVWIDLATTRGGGKFDPRRVRIAPRIGEGT